MDIAVVSHDTFWPLRGGGGIRVQWVAKCLVKTGHTVTVFAPFLQDKGLNEEFGAMRFVNLGRISRFVPLKEIVYFYLMTGIFFRLLFRKFDIIYAHNVVAAVPSVLVGMIRGKPVIVDMDDLLTGYSRNSLVYRFGSRLECWTARRSRSTIVTSEYVKKWSEERGITNTHIVRHGVDLALFFPQASERRDIILTGGIEVNDGVLLIPYAAQIILKKFPNEKFVFVGEGKELKTLKRLVTSLNLENSFIFEGWKDHKEIPEILCRSRIGLITSLKVSATDFSSPLRTYEYMAVELPYVASDLCGIREQVELSGSGILFKSGDAEDLATAILTLLEDERLRNALGRRGRQYVLENCDWQKNAERICQICLAGAGRKTQI